MKLAVSQIAWQPGEEPEALAMLRRAGFAGLEIAPSLAVGQAPYDHPEKAAAYAERVKTEYGLALCSMQSIWYGIDGSMFGAERPMLLEYTQKAICFARAAGCGNLVFGCPKNRVLPQGESGEAAVSFFKQLGGYAAERGTVLSLEANPAIYGTNFINHTAQAFAMAQRVDSPGFMVNLDVGTLVANDEDVEGLREGVPLVRHVHVSEPMLAPIQRRPLHRQLADLLRQQGYGGYVSIEMKAAGLDALRQAMDYVAEVFG